MGLRHSGIASVIVLALLAGCASPSVPPSSGDAGLLRFPPAQAMDQPGDGGEPSLAILPDGTLFLAAGPCAPQDEPNVAEGRNWLWRSRDHGASWERLRGPAPLRADPRAAPFAAHCDADVAASPDGWIYQVTEWNAGPEGNRDLAGDFVVEASGDGGDTWTRALAAAAGPGIKERPWLVAGPGGFVGLAYFEATLAAVAPAPASALAGPVRAVWTSSADHGASWAPPRTLLELPGRVVVPGKPVLLLHGTLAVPLMDTEPDLEAFPEVPGRVLLALSADAGATWSVEAVAEAGEGFGNALAVAAAPVGEDGLAVAWAARAGETISIQLRHRAGGASWDAPAPVAGGGLHVQPWLAGDGHRLAVAWYGSDATGDPLRVPAATPWFAWAADLTSPGPWRAVRISEEPVKLGPLCPGRFARCDREGVPSELKDFLGLALAPEGGLHAAFTRARDLQGQPAGWIHHAGPAP